MAIEKIGNWSNVQALISNLGEAMLKARDLSLKRFSLKAEALAKQHMSSQDLGWDKLKPATIAAKIRRGESTEILIATADYFQAITSWASQGVAFAGVRKQIHNSNGDLLADIARIHELGLGDNPERKLWEPSYKETIEWFKSSDSTPVKLFAKEIEKYL